MIPLLPTALLAVLLAERTAVAIVVGCGGLLLTALFALLVVFVAAMWTVRATAELGLGGITARAAMGRAWSALRGDFGRHLIVALVMFVVGMAGSTFFAGVSFLIGFGETFNDSNVFPLVTLPFRFATSIINSILSAVISTWYLGSYAAMAAERGEGNDER
jgi:hypothetical protein